MDTPLASPGLASEPIRNMMGVITAATRNVFAKNNSYSPMRAKTIFMGVLMVNLCIQIIIYP